MILLNSERNYNIRTEELQIKNKHCIVFIALRKVLSGSVSTALALDMDNLFFNLALLLE